MSAGGKPHSPALGTSFCRCCFPAVTIKVQAGDSSHLACADSMKLRSPWLIKIAAILAAAFIRLWMSTMRARAVVVDGSQHPVDPAKTKYIYAFWHESLLA